MPEQPLFEAVKIEGYDTLKRPNEKGILCTHVVAASFEAIW